MKLKLAIIALCFCSAASAQTLNRALEYKRMEFLHKLILGKCPIVGVSAPDWTKKETWTVFYESGPEKNALKDACAGPVVSTFDLSQLPQ